MSKDQLASEVGSPSNPLGLNYSDLVEDEVWPSKSGAGSQHDRPANYSVEEWLDLVNTVGAIDVATQEWLDYQARLRDAKSHTQSLPTSPQNGPAARQYAPHEFREDQLILPGGSRTRQGALLREGSTPPILLQLNLLAQLPLPHRSLQRLQLLTHLQHLPLMTMWNQENNGCSRLFPDGGV